MKFKIFKIMAVAVFAIIAGYNVYLAKAENGNVVSDVLLANVEALSQSENSGAEISCSAKCNDGIGKCWLKSGGDFCVFSGSQLDYCTGYGCKKYDGTIYY